MIRPQKAFITSASTGDPDLAPLSLSRATINLDRALAALLFAEAKQTLRSAEAHFDAEVGLPVTAGDMRQA